MAHRKEDQIYRFIEALGWPFYQFNGQRVLGPRKDIPTPAPGTEIMIKQLPLDFFENELHSICIKFGPIYSMRTLVNFTGETRGVAYVKYWTIESANMAAKKLNRCMVRRKFIISVEKSIDNLKLYVGGIPSKVTEEELLDWLEKNVDGVMSVKFGPMRPTKKSRSYKYAFVEFKSHREAAIARRNFRDNYVMWEKNIKVDWAKPEVFLNPEAMINNKKIFIRNLAPFISVTDMAHIILNMMHSKYIERIYIKSGYGFIHLTTHNAAKFLLTNLKGKIIGNLPLHVEWARPASTEDILLSNYKSIPYKMVKERRRRRRQKYSTGG